MCIQTKIKRNQQYRYQERFTIGGFISRVNLWQTPLYGVAISVAPGWCSLVANTLRSLLPHLVYPAYTVTSWVASGFVTLPIDSATAAYLLHSNSLCKPRRCISVLWIMLISCPRLSLDLLISPTVNYCDICCFSKTPNQAIYLHVPLPSCPISTTQLSICCFSAGNLSCCL